MNQWVGPIAVGKRFKNDSGGGSHSARWFLKNARDAIASLAT